MALELGKTANNQQGKMTINQQHHLNTSMAQNQWGAYRNSVDHAYTWYAPMLFFEVQPEKG
eukprot:9036889-Ditylum_brightwellii.AAC.1